MESPGKLGQRAVLRTFTPADAAKYLEKNESRDFQRHVSQIQVNRIADDLRAGRWKVNGETIVIDKEGRVIDGQHRLWGCIEAGMDLSTWVVEGVESSAFTTLDTGKTRSATDIVGIVSKYEGMTAISAAACQGAARAIRLLLCFNAKGQFTPHKKDKKNMRLEAVRIFLETHPELLDDSQQFASFGRWPLPMGMAVAIHFQTKKAFDNSVPEFWHPLQSGVGIGSEEEPVYMLRKRATDHPRSREFKLESDIFAQVVKAWNAYALGRKIRQLKYAAGNEYFPSLCLRPGVEPAETMAPAEKVAESLRGRRIPEPIVAKSVANRRASILARTGRNGRI